MVEAFPSTLGTLFSNRSDGSGWRREKAERWSIMRSIGRTSANPAGRTGSGAGIARAGPVSEQPYRVLLEKRTGAAGAAHVLDERRYSSASETQASRRPRLLSLKET